MADFEIRNELGEELFELKITESNLKKLLLMSYDSKRFELRFDIGEILVEEKGR